MADLLLELTKNPLARRIASSLPLPVSLPPTLNRRDTHWSNTELAEKKILIVGSDKGLSKILKDHGASMVSLPESTEEQKDETKIDGLVIHLDGVKSPSELDRAYQALHNHLKRFRRNGRVVLLIQNVNQALTRAVAAMTKSLAKELGKAGSTANAVIYTKGEAQGNNAALWLLSDRSAFVSGQCIQLNPAAIDSETHGDQLLSGKVALVTGASRGIGLAICRALRREGAEILAVDHPSQEAALKEACEEWGGQPLSLDLGTPNAVSVLSDFIGQSFGQIDLIVHNAGITRDRTIKRMSAEEWQQVMTVNYDFPVAMSKRVLGQTDDGLIPLLKPGGSVVMISSIVGLAGNFGQTNYAAAKGGLIGAVSDLAAKSSKHRINAISCGFIETSMTAKIPPLIREVARRMNALKQGGLPEDIAESCVFLASGLAADVSGQTLRVCGAHPTGA